MGRLHLLEELVLFPDSFLYFATSFAFILFSVSDFSPSLSVLELVSVGVLAALDFSTCLGLSLLVLSLSQFCFREKLYFCFVFHFRKNGALGACFEDFDFLVASLNCAGSLLEGFPLF